MSSSTCCQAHKERLTGTREKLTICGGFNYENAKHSMSAGEITVHDRSRATVATQRIRGSSSLEAPGIGNTEHHLIFVAHTDSPAIRVTSLVHNDLSPNLTSHLHRQCELTYAISAVAVHFVSADDHVVAVVSRKNPGLVVVVDLGVLHGPAWASRF